MGYHSDSIGISRDMGPLSLSGLFLIGAFGRSRKRRRRNQENPRNSRQLEPPKHVQNSLQKLCCTTVALHPPHPNGAIAPGAGDIASEATSCVQVRSRCSRGESHVHIRMSRYTVQLWFTPKPCVLNVRGLGSADLPD